MSISDLDRLRPSTWRARLTAVGVAVVAPLIVGFVASVAGVTLTVPSPLVGSLTVDALLVFVTALPAGLAAWGVLAMIERRAASPRRVWAAASTAVLIVSLPPLLFLDVPASTKITLALMHLACGLPLILLLGDTADRARRDSSRASRGTATRDGQAAS